MAQWTKELGDIAAVESARQLNPENVQVMVIHGGNDGAVPALDARTIADAHGNAELRLIDGARHHLRHDPRAMATAIGFLNRRGRGLGTP